MAAETIMFDVCVRVSARVRTHVCVSCVCECVRVCSNTKDVAIAAKTIMLDV